MNTTLVSGLHYFSLNNQKDYSSQFVFTVKKPTSVSYVVAAGCIGDAVKAYTALHYLGRMCSGETGSYHLSHNFLSGSGNNLITFVTQFWC